MYSKCLGWLKKYKSLIVVNIVFLCLVGLFYIVHGLNPIKHYYVEKTQNDYDFYMPIYSGIVLIQPFECNIDNIDTIDLPISASDWNYDGDFVVSIANEDGTYAQTWNMSKADLSERTGWVQFNLNTPLSRGSTYDIFVQAPNLEKENCIEIRMTGAQDLINRDNSITFIECTYNSPLEGYVALSLSKAHTNIFAVISLSLLLVLINICWFCRNKNIERYGIFIVGIMGTIVLLMVSPGAVNDDDYHYYSSLMLSNIIMGKSNVIEIEGEYRYKLDNDSNSNENYCLLIDEVFDFSDIDKSMSTILVGERTAGTWLNTLIYPISHLIPAIGITIGRMLSLNFIQTYTLARIFVFITYLLACKYVLEVLPYKRELAVILMINPMLLQQVTSLNYDAVIIILSLIFTAYIMKVAVDKRPLTWSAIILLIILICLFGPIKAVYYVHLLLFFIIPNECFENIKDRVFKTLSFILSVPIINIIVNKAYTYVEGKSAIVTTADSGSVNANNFVTAVKSLKTYYGISDVISNPIESVRIVVNTIEANITTYIKELFGSKMAVTSNMPEYLIICIIVLTIMAVYIKTDDEIICLKMYTRIILLAVALIEIGLIIGAGFLMTTYGEKVLTGIQGRYFIPCLLPFFYAIVGSKNTLPIRKSVLFYGFCYIYVGIIFNINMVL
ncbi:MAG: DUF2142 domain-containing protein [Pseudobutyrivibrio ruminis]|uniref:DUF2142 domain-containing protein n=1 Tax=Pseudobutyrivibrio ruminis TaxID=46206 RepID=UPI0026EC68C1|nr:DUF2142 domain-containing protein [Pseudobutyrivibrio ruminis]MBE5912929.1 DUF2142 domain-containing protein [Pseudobutyrivibrio ruminis]